MKRKPKDSGPDWAPESLTTILEPTRLDRWRSRVADWSLRTGSREQSADSDEKDGDRRTPRQLTGAWAEAEALRWLKRRGYRPVARNVRYKGGEIDLVAEHRGVLCFVEVRARSGSGFGGAVASIGPKKRRRLRTAAQLYLMKNPSDRPCRFDVVCLDRQPDGRWRLELIPDAFGDHAAPPG